MSFKKTISLSLFLHLCLFTATLLLSARLSGSSSKMHYEDVFFVNLIVDSSKPVEELVIVQRKKSKPGTSMKQKAEKGQSITIHAEIVPMKTEIDGENNNPNTYTLSAMEKPAVHALSGNYGAKDNTAIVLSSGVETITKNALKIFFSDGKGALLNKNESGAGLIEAIRNSIEKAKTYPFLARKRGIEGTVHISFRVNPRGEPEDIRILNSSGSDILDSATLNIVKKAAPFPPIDSPIEVPVVFRLN